MARSLRARHGCQAGEKINVAWPTFVAEEFEKKNTKEKEKEQKSKKEDKKNQFKNLNVHCTKRAIFQIAKKDKSHKANPRMMAGWLLMLCWSVPCCAAFDTNKDLAANHDVNYTGRPGLIVENATTQSNGPPEMTRNGKKWQLTIDVPRSGRQIADALSEYGSVDVEAGFRLLTEVSATTFDIHPYGSGSDPSKRKFPGILNVILDLVARCHHGKFGFYPLNFVSSKMWNLGLEWWKIGFRPWESFPLEMWNFEMGWFDEKIHWSPFLIWFCLGTMGEICGWLLRYGVTKQFVLACLKRAQDKRKRKRIIKRLKNKRSVKKCSDLKRCQKLLKPHVACAARKCSTHRLGKARLKHRRCALKLRMRWTYVRTNGMDVSLSYSFLYSGFPRPEEWPLGYDALSWYKPDANNCIFASEWLQGGYKRRTQRKKNYSDNDNAAVRSLIQGLKVCLNQGSFPKEFESVMSLLGQVVGQNSPKKMFKKKKTVKQEPKPDPSRQEQLRDNKDEDYTILETGWWKMNGAWVRGNSIAETHKQDGGGGTSVVTKLPQWTTTPDIMKRNKTLRFTNLNRILQTLPRCELSTQLNGTSQSNLWMRKQFARPLRKEKTGMEIFAAVMTDRSPKNFVTCTQALVSRKDSLWFCQLMQ